MVITGDMEMFDIMDPACWETRLGLGLWGAFWGASLLWGPYNLDVMLDPIMGSGLEWLAGTHH